ncbi:hypothetical protein PENSPDRAFT_132665 [Peniophora sp. CONT]|nr:hypothetical protein PENSPDRAFT_132665 [Peniophora sp. CONT]
MYIDLYASLADVPPQHPFLAAFNAVASTLETRSAHDLLDDTVSRDELAKPWACAERVLELVVHELRVRRNAIVPGISRLPPEVLSLILLHCSNNESPREPLPEDDIGEYLYYVDRDQYYEEDQAHHDWNRLVLPLGGQLGWIRLTHVCRSWRSLLLNTPKHWADSFGLLPAASKEILQRAGNRFPVTIHAIATDSRDMTWTFADLFTSNTSLIPASVRSRVRAIYCLDLRSAPTTLTRNDSEVNH